MPIVLLWIHGQELFYCMSKAMVPPLGNVSKAEFPPWETLGGTDGSYMYIYVRIYPNVA